MTHSGGANVELDLMNALLAGGNPRHTILENGAVGTVDILSDQTIAYVQGPYTYELNVVDPANPTEAITYELLTGSDLYFDISISTLSEQRFFVTWGDQAQVFNADATPAGGGAAGAVGI